MVSPVDISVSAQSVTTASRKPEDNTAQFESAEISTSQESSSDSFTASVDFLTNSDDPDFVPGEAPAYPPEEEPEHPNTGDEPAAFVPGEAPAYPPGEAPELPNEEVAAYDPGQEQPSAGEPATPYTPPTSEQTPEPISGETFHFARPDDSPLPLIPLNAELDTTPGTAMGFSTDTVSAQIASDTQSDGLGTIQVTSEPAGPQANSGEPAGPRPSSSLEEPAFISNPNLPTFDPSVDKPMMSIQTPEDLAKAKAEEEARNAQAAEMAAQTKASILDHSKTFDAKSYAGKYGVTEDDALNDYLNSVAAGQPKNPNAFFDEQFYLETNPDVAEAIKNGDYTSGWDHYMKSGSLQNRAPNKIDAPYFVAQQDDVIAARAAAAARANAPVVEQSAPPKANPFKVEAPAEEAPVAEEPPLDYDGIIVLPTDQTVPFKNEPPAAPLKIEISEAEHQQFLDDAAKAGIVVNPDGSLTL